MNYPKLPKYQVGGINFNTQTKNCVKGNCEDGTLRATKSKVTKTKPFSTKGLPKGTSYNKMMRKKKRKARKEQKRIKKIPGNAPSYANPRFL